MGAGVPAVVNSPVHRFASTLMPDSINVGTSGMAGERFTLVTASPRSFPCFTNGCGSRIFRTEKPTSPEACATNTGAEPL